MPERAIVPHDRRMSDVDPLQRSRELGPRIEALRAEATAVRDANWKVHLVKEKALAVERDQLTRRKAGLERSAEEADQHAKVLSADAQKKTDEVQWAEEKVVELEGQGNYDTAELVREALPAERAARDANQARADQAKLDATEHREQVTAIDRRLGEIWTARGEVRSQIDRIELHTDRLEEQAELLQQVRRKWSEIALEPDNIPRRAELELEVEALTKRADAIVVDRDVLRTVVPDLPETAPVAQHADVDEMVGTIAAPAIAAPAVGAPEAEVDVLGGDVFASTTDAAAPPPADPSAPAVPDAAEAPVSSPEPAAVEAEAPAQVATFDDFAPVEEPATFEQSTSDQEVAFDEPTDPEPALDVA